MEYLYNIKKSNIFHLMNNNITCSSKYLNKLSKIKNEEDNNINEVIFIKSSILNKSLRLCKKCIKLFIKKYNINNIIYDCYNNIIYENILENKLLGNIDLNGNIFIEKKNLYINLISIKDDNDIIKKYYLINNKDLYNIDELDILNIDLSLKKGKLLGPKMFILKKKLIIIKKIKLNLWEVI